MIEINAIGLACPIPVVKAKKVLMAIDGAGDVMVYVDNKASADNLEKLAKSLKCGFEVNQTATTQYTVIISKSKAFTDNSLLGKVDTIAIISGNKMGEGDDELGKSLMKAFIYALSESETTPAKMIFYNSGALLPIEGSAVLDDIKTLADKGAEILTCGTCLDYYGKTEKLAVGSITNMYAILECMNSAGKIIKP